jgi:hypothetical protein
LSGARLYLITLGFRFFEITGSPKKLNSLRKLGDLGGSAVLLLLSICSTIDDKGHQKLSQKNKNLRTCYTEITKVTQRVEIRIVEYRSFEWSRRKLARYYKYFTLTG